MQNYQEAYRKLISFIYGMINKNYSPLLFSSTSLRPSSNLVARKFQAGKVSLVIVGMMQVGASIIVEAFLHQVCGIFGRTGAIHAGK